MSMQIMMCKSSNVIKHFAANCAGVGVQLVAVLLEPFTLTQLLAELRMLPSDWMQLFRADQAYTFDVCRSMPTVQLGWQRALFSHINANDVYVATIVVSIILGCGILSANLMLFHLVYFQIPTLRVSSPADVAFVVLYPSVFVDMSR